MVNDLNFGYLAVKENSNSDRPSSIIAHLVDIDRPLQAVVWNVKVQAWEFNPRTAAAFLYDEKYFDERFRVDRAEADRIAQDVLHTPLPSEEELRQICAAGLAARTEQEDLSADFDDDEDDWDAEDDSPADQRG